MRRGIDIKAGKDVNVMRTLRVQDAMTKNVDAVPEDAVVGDVIKLMQKTRHTGFPVLSEKKELIGIITLEDIRDIKPAEKRLSVPVREVMTKELITVHPDETLADVFRKFSYEGIGRLPVVSKNSHRRLLGLITRSDIIRAYNRALEERERV